MEEFEKSHDEDVFVKNEICDESGFTSESFSKEQPFVLRDEKSYNCDECDNIFDSLIAFEQHIKEHDEHSFDTACDNIDPLALCSSVLRAGSPVRNEEKPWRCDKCDKIFDSLSALEVHASDHVEDIYEYYYCTKCNTGTVFDSASELQSHIERNHADVSSSTPDTSFTRSSNIMSNETVQNGKESYRCGWCKRLFYNLRLYNNHIDFLKTKSFICCEKTFECEGLLQCHINNVHSITIRNKKVQVCEICTMSFTNRQSFQVHILKHRHTVDTPTMCDTPNNTLNKLCSSKLHDSSNAEKSVTCSKCNQSFRCTESLQSHECSKSLTCKICNKSFQVERSLKRHMNSHAGENPYQCELCNRSYSSREAFLRHKEIQHGLRDTALTCKICNMSFESKKSLYWHERKKHNPLTCKICNKSFASRNFLQRHIHVHHGSNTHTCKICNKSFEARESLLSHEHTQHNEHACEICNKSYVSKTSLRWHKHIQHGFTDGTPHTCKVCDKSFINEDAFLRHEFKKHNLHDPYICNICNKSYASMNSFLWHKRADHGLTEDTPR